MDHLYHEDLPHQRFWLHETNFDLVVFDVAAMESIVFYCI